MSKEKQCWICHRPEQEVAEELIKLKAKGVLWAIGITKDDLVTLSFNNKKDHTLDFQKSYIVYQTLV